MLAITRRSRQGVGRQLGVVSGPLAAAPLALVRRAGLLQGGLPCGRDIDMRSQQKLSIPDQDPEKAISVRTHSS